MASPARASRALAAPPSQEADDIAPPSAARLASEAIGDYRVRGSLHAALQDASTWLAQLSAIEVGVVSVEEHVYCQLSAVTDWLMHSGVPRGASRVRDSRQRTRRRRSLFSFGRLECAGWRNGTTKEIRNDGLLDPPQRTSQRTSIVVRYLSMSARCGPL